MGHFQSPISQEDLVPKQSEINFWEPEFSALGQVIVESLVLIKNPITRLQQHFCYLVFWANKNATPHSKIKDTEHGFNLCLTICHGLLLTGKTACVSRGLSQYREHNVQTRILGVLKLDRFGIQTQEVENAVHFDFDDITSSAKLRSDRIIKHLWRRYWCRCCSKINCR